MPSSPAPIAARAERTDRILVTPLEGTSVVSLRATLTARGFDVDPGVGMDAFAAVRVPPGTDAARLAAELAQRVPARNVEADGVVRAQREPNDPLYRQEQGYLDVIHAARAWDSTTGGAEVLIAIVDSGVAWDQPDLRDRLFYNTREAPLSAVDADGNGCPADIVGCNFVSLATADPSCEYTAAPPNWRTSDDEGHGTFVAGLAAAAGDNGAGITGIAWNARILPVKVLDCTATGRIADAAAGIRYAARMGAQVINVSFGATADSLVLREAVEEAQARGSMIVASAGNESQRAITYPAAYPGVVSVAASGRIGAEGVDYRSLALFTNFGGVDVMAPGVGVVSTVPEAACGTRGWTCIDGPYASASGSSFATPIVAGAVALLRARFPDLSPALLRSILLGSRQPGTLAADPGLLDIGAAVDWPIYSNGAPGTSRAGDGPPRGPAVGPGGR
ncbi:MAG: S8 family serine peptidase [Dehalococcoidia bacterium]